MKVRMLSDVSDEVRSYEAQDVVDLPDDKAERFIKQGLAEALDAKKAAALEAAALKDAEKRG